MPSKEEIMEVGMTKEDIIELSVSLEDDSLIAYNYLNNDFIQIELMRQKML